MTRAYHGQIIAIACMLALTACGPAHIQLQGPPAKDSSLKERRDHYQHQRPKLVQTKPHRHRPWEPTPFLVLADGTQVNHAPDLLPLVDDTSPTAQAARKAETDESIAHALSGAGWAFAVAGVVGATAFLIDSVPRNFADQAPPSKDEATGSFVWAMSSYAAMGVGLALVTIAGEFFASGAVEQETAFLTYDRSLRARLALTEEDLTAEMKQTDTPPVSPTLDGQQ